MFVEYGNSVSNNYSLDDDIVTVTDPEGHNNPRIEKGIKGIPEIFTSRHIESTKQSYAYRPLTLSTFAIEYQFFKGNPHISHFINVLLFILTCILLSKILRNIFSEYHVILPFLATVLFLIHPIHTEVVNSLKNRDELLSLLFGLMSLQFVLKYVSTSKKRYLVLSAVMLGLAVLSKETARLFVVLIPLVVIFFKPVGAKKILYYIVSVIIIVALIYIIRKILIHDIPVSREFVFTENPLFYNKSIINRIPAAIYFAGYYLRLLIIPFPLSAYYGYDTVPVATWAFPGVWISLLIYMALFVVAMRKIKERNVLSFAILFFLIAITPFTNIIKPGPGMIAERFAYIASIGFCIAVAWLLLKAFKIHFGKNEKFENFKASSLIFFALVLCVTTVYNISRNSLWKDILTLCRHDIKTFENSYNLRYIIINTLVPELKKTTDDAQRKKMIEEIKQQSKKITEIVEKGINQYPDDYLSRNNLGVIYINYLKQPQKALPYFKEAVLIKPENTESLYNLGYCYSELGSYDSAIVYFKKALETDVYYSYAYSKLHDIYTEKKEYRNAIINSEKALQFFPDHAEYYVNLGNSYLFLNDTLKGIEYFEKALELDPENDNLRSQIVKFLNNSGFSNKAEELHKK